MTTDPRARHLAEAAHRVAREKATKLPEWKHLPLTERDKVTAEARLWLRAAIEAGIAPTAERPTDDHDAVYVDELGFLYGEYRSAPATTEVHLLRLQWTGDVPVAKSELEADGATVRLLGWSK